MNLNTTISGIHSRRLLNACAGIVRTARPRQWIKNAFVLAPLLFSGRIKDGESIFFAAVATFACIFASAATYIWNDIADYPLDRQHPTKRYRPLAAGQISARFSATVAIFSAALSLSLAAYLNIATFTGIGGYLLMQFLYTLWLKHKAIADVMCIALGFVLRVIVGAMAITVTPSPWLLVCTLFLATFLGFAKRRGETVRLLSDTGYEVVQRPVLILYNRQLLLSLLSITCSLTMQSYALYAIEREPTSLILLGTIPVVAYALFRYLLLILYSEETPNGESPEDLLLHDRGLIAAGFIWVGMCVVAILVSPPLPLK